MNDAKPVLPARAVGPAPGCTASGSLLLVDDEPHVLSALGRLFQLEGWTVHCAQNAAEALALLRVHDIGVLLTDNRMPGESGVNLLARARFVRPDTMRLLMTGYADLATAVEAINEGEVYRLILKPWSDRELLATVTEACHRHGLIRQLRTGDDAVVRSLAQAIELKDHYTRGHCDRVADYALRIAHCMGLDEEQHRDIRQGSWLHDCGKIGVPGAILNFPGRLDPEMFDVVKRHTIWGADLAREAALAPRVVNIILHHHERMDGTGYPSGLVGTAIPLDARIVAAADVYDAMTTDRSYKKGMTRRDGMQELRRLRGHGLDADVTDVFLGVLRELDDGPAPN